MAKDVTEFGGQAVGAVAQLTSAGTNALVDVVDHSTKAVVVGLRETNDALVATGVAALNIEDRTVDAALDELEKLRQQYVNSARNILNALLGAAEGGQS